MALPGIAGGIFMARVHGRTGPGFVVALGSTFVVRLVLAGIVTYGAQRTGQGSVHGVLQGLAAGFVPLTALEMVWFAREAQRQALRTERHG